MSYKNNISSIEYYNNTISDNYVNIFNKYNSIIIDYLKHCFDNIYIQNNQYKKYIIRQGILTITHVFKLLLIYTKNIDLTYFNCQKAYVYFIEFIGQIGEDNHSFLQLNSKDASLFVYKKTIFDINNDVTKNYKSDINTKNLFKSLDPLINIYTFTIFKLINDYEFNEIIKLVNLDFQKIMQKIIKYYIEINELEFLDKIYKFIIYYKDANLLETLDCFIKKIKKKDTINNIELLIINQRDKNILSPNKYINNIINNL
jgi:hypothetical protein